MKQMRSRFRLITLLLACAFLLTLVVCTGSALKAAGVSISALSIPAHGGTASPEPSLPPETTPEEAFTPAPAEPADEEPILPGTDNSPDQEYNIFGL